MYMICCKFNIGYIIFIYNIYIYIIYLEYLLGLSNVGHFFFGDLFGFYHQAHADPGAIGPQRVTPIHLAVTWR